MNLRSLAIAVIVLTATITITLPSATAIATSTTYTDAFGNLTALEKDIVQQAVQTMEPFWGSCSFGPTQETISITAGTTYYLTTGGSSLSNLSVNIGGVLAYSFATATPSTLLYSRAGWGATLIWSETDASPGGVNMVAITPTSGGSVTISCTGTAIGRFAMAEAQRMTIGMHGVTSAVGPPVTPYVIAFRTDNVTIQGENGILSTQTSKTPSTSKILWQRLNLAQTLVQTTAGDVVTPRQFVQTFTANALLGKYLETVTYDIRADSVACSGTASIAVSNQFNTANDWNVSAEIVNVTFSFTVTTAGTGTITIDWINGVISETVSPLTIGTPVWKVGGVVVTDFGAMPPAILSGTYAIHGYHSSTNQECMVPYKTTTDTYSGGAYHDRNDAASSWVTSTGDLGGAFFKVYGGNILEHRLNATQKHLGGAYYTYVAEHQMDSTTQLANPTSSWGGAPLFGNTLYSLTGGAGSTDCSFGGVNRACRLTEYRLGFITMPLNATQTLTVTYDLSATGRNLIYTGTLTNQPTQTNIARWTFDNQAGTNPDMIAYNLMSTDDYAFQVFFYVNECQSIDGNGLCSAASTTRIPNGSYNGLIRGLRAFSGTWNTTGEFNISGQDLGGGITTLTLTATNFITETDLQISIPTTSGSYFVNLTMVRGTGAGITVTAQGVSVTFVPTSSCLTTGQSIAMNLTRNKPVELWVGLYRLDSIGNPQLITTLFGWTTTLNATINYTFPDGRNFSAADTGKYVLAVFLQSTENVTGKVVGYAKIGVNDVCDFPLGVSFLTNLNEIAQTNIVTATQSTTASIAQREDTAYENYLGALSWAFRKDLLGIPNMVLWLAVFFGLALTLRFGTSGFGRKGRDE